MPILYQDGVDRMSRGGNITHLRKIARLFHIYFGEQDGFGLAESLVAVAILGTVVVMLIGGLTTGSITININQEDIIAENLGRTQMEYTKSLPYNTAPYTYQSITDVPDGYSVTAEASSISDRDNNIQRITVTVNYRNKRAYVLEGFKVNR